MNKQSIYDQLVEKSQEAFILGIELYNKPTIKYRVEGFAFMVCNAWELMLKAKIIKDSGEDAIYYKDNPERTISLSNCISQIFTNTKDPLRRNLEEIIDLRDTSTHFITQEYELVYVPLFQACVNNYSEKLLEFHGIDITKQIPNHFLNLAVGSQPLLVEEIQSRYSKIVFSNFFKKYEKVAKLEDENQTDRFAIVIRQDYRLVKSKDSNIPSFRYVKNGEEPDGNVMVLKEIQNPNMTHPYARKKIIENVNKRLSKLEIDMSVNKNHIQDFISYYNIKEDPKYCYVNKTYTNLTYSYSPALVDMIVAEIQKDNGCFEKIHNILSKKRAKK